MEDVLKNTWDRFVEFVNNIVGKFLEAITKLLAGEKNYLERYRDIIQKRPGKEIDFEYDGNYEIGIERIKNTPIPMFDFGNMRSALQAGDAQFIKDHINKDIEYDDNGSMADQFKDFFQGGNVVTKKQFKDINFTNLYNYCYNHKELEDAIKKDQAAVKNSTSRIQQALKQAIAAAEKQKAEKTQEQPETNTTTEPENSNTTATPSESYRYRLSNMIFEADGDQQERPNTGVKMDQNQINQVSKISKDDAKKMAGDIVKTDGELTQEDAKTIILKYKNITQACISAKLTIAQRIAKNYMEIIRAHVRSYVGTGAEKNFNIKK